jgi:hypothetical protein
VSHYIIQRSGPHSFVLSDKTFINLVELINFYRIHLLDISCLTVPLVRVRVRPRALAPCFFRSLTVSTRVGSELFRISSTTIAAMLIYPAACHLICVPLRVAAPVSYAAQQPEKEALRNGVRINHFLVTVRAKHNFNGRDPEDLSFRKGEMLNVVEKHEPQWWKAQSQDTLQVGVIPSNYVDQYALGPIEIAKKEAAEAAKKRAEYESQASAKVRTRSTEPLLSIACIYTVTPWLAG